MNKEADGTYTLSFKKRKQYFCSECGAPAVIKKEKPYYDDETGELKGYFLSLGCTAHRFKHAYQRTFERISK